jgi:hypothetical protein
MTTRKEVLARIAALGATYTEAGERMYELLVDAPDGCVFASDGCHQHVNQQGYGEPRSDCYASALSRLTMGTEPCTDPDCEICSR